MLPPERVVVATAPGDFLSYRAASGPLAVLTCSAIPARGASWFCHRDGWLHASRVQTSALAGP